MALSRRRMLGAAAGIAAAPIRCAIAKAQGYPLRPVRFVVPFPPGGVSDIIARLIGQKCAVLNDRVIGARFAELGGAAMIGSSAEYRAFLAEETDKWARVVRTARLAPG